MHPSELLDSVVELHSQLEVTPDVDPELLEQARNLDAQMHQMIKSNELKAEESLTQQLIDMEAQFSSDHPVLERLTREVIDRLAQMGIQLDPFRIKLLFNSTKNHEKLSFRCTHLYFYLNVPIYLLNPELIASVWTSAS